MQQTCMKKVVEMHIYNIGYNSYEESEYVQLYHEKKFSQKEFENIVIEAVVSVLKKYKELKNSSVEDSRLKSRTTFQNMLFSVIEMLVKKFGFKEVKFIGKFDVFGWADILDENDWEDNRDEQLNKLTKSVKQKLKIFSTKEGGKNEPDSKSD